MPEIAVVICAHCKNKVKPGKKHSCGWLWNRHKLTAPTTIEEWQQGSNNGDFRLSYIVASITDNTLLGYAIGGNFPGAFGGMNHNNQPHNEQVYPISPRNCASDPEEYSDSPRGRGGDSSCGSSSDTGGSSSDTGGSSSDTSDWS